MMTRQMLGAACWLVVLAVAAGAAASEPFVFEETAAAVDEDRSTAATVWFQGFLAERRDG